MTLPLIADKIYDVPSNTMCGKVIVIIKNKNPKGSAPENIDAVSSGVDDSVVVTTAGGIQVTGSDVGDVETATVTTPGGVEVTGTAPSDDLEVEVEGDTAKIRERVATQKTASVQTGEMEITAEKTMEEKRVRVQAGELDVVAQKQDGLKQVRVGNVQITKEETPLRVATGGVKKEVKISSDGSVVILKSEEVQARTQLRVEAEQTTEEEAKLQVTLSNGKKAEVKVMPSTASETAIAKLELKVCSAENNCEIELKETGTGSEAKLTYEVKAKKESRLFGFIKKDMEVEVQLDAETGVVVKAHKPWWAFLAAE
jgi:hypothetical protein